MCGVVGLEVNLPGDMYLQGAWEGCYNLRDVDPFTTDFTRDVFPVTFSWGDNDLQVAYAWMNEYDAQDPSEDRSLHLFGAGYGRRIERGSVEVEPYGMAIVGFDSRNTVWGGVTAGVILNYRSAVHIGVEGDLAYTFLYGDTVEHFLRALVGVYYSVPTRWNTELRFGLQGFIDYQAPSDDAAIGVRIVLEWRGRHVRHPLPMPGEL
jgi:hypothetical protein